MISKQFIKRIVSLADTKGRRRQNAFVVEGTKAVLDTITAFDLQHLIATSQWLESHPIDAIDPSKIVEAKRADILQMTSMSLAPDVMAVYTLPPDPVVTPDECKGQLIIALDRVQDPGNLGTIIRTADWMGVPLILASTDTVDCYNPKAIQATMGAIARVKVVYCDLCDILEKLGQTLPVYGTFLDGENIYSSPLSREGVIIMGNEGKGISENVARLASHRLLIPSYPPERPTSESLNVATATAIVLSQFRARILKQ